MDISLHLMLWMWLPETLDKRRYLGLSLVMRWLVCNLRVWKKQVSRPNWQNPSSPFIKGYTQVFQVSISNYAWTLKKKNRLTCPSNISKRGWHNRSNHKSMWESLRRETLVAKFSKFWQTIENFMRRFHVVLEILPFTLRGQKKEVEYQEVFSSKSHKSDNYDKAPYILSS